MKKALEAPMATGRIKRCGTCSHGGYHFKIFGKTHLHCEHKDEEVAGEPGWGTLRNWFDKGCPQWSPRVKEEISSQNAGDVARGANGSPSPADEKP